MNESPFGFDNTPHSGLLRRRLTWTAKLSRKAAAEATSGSRRMPKVVPNEMRDEAFAEANAKAEQSPSKNGKGHPRGCPFHFIFP